MSNGKPEEADGHSQLDKVKQAVRKLQTDGDSQRFKERVGKPLAGKKRSVSKP